MKRFLVTYLWKEASFFSWLVVLLLLGTLLYGGVIIADMQTNREAMMGFFILPVFVGIIIVVIVADILTRRKGPAKRSRLLLLQLLLALPFLWLGWHRYFYQTTLYLQADTTWILVVQNHQTQPGVHRNFFLQRTTIDVATDGIVLLDRPFSKGERMNLQVINRKAEKEPYVGEYSNGSYSPELKCNGITYPTFVLLIEKQPNRLSPLSDSVLQDLYRKACLKLK
ncbi:hypothetical protein WG954_05890 [Lacibacter sp. H375]|uniref:hypothetical protein n=1 Tax=Lacibacter sp. H375 TaxID=3133424 RepID=UPI0030C4257B